MIAKKIRFALSMTGQWLQRFVPPGRNLTVFDDDVFIVSYPKSGNTWVRFMLGNLISPDNMVTFSNIEQIIPDIYQNSTRVIEGVNKPRILKSHEYLDPRYRRVIYIVRDPRDIAISYYHYLIKMRVIEIDSPLFPFICRFVSGQLDPYGAWNEHVGGWLGARTSDNDFLIFRYEDMLDNPAQALRNMSEFLNFSATNDRIEHAVRMSSFNHMQVLERRESDQWTPIKSSMKDKFFVRKAQKGGWKKELPEKCTFHIESAWKNMMLRFGYLPSEK